MTNELGGWSISERLLHTMLEYVPRGVVLELGSGYGTEILSQHYTVYSIEHDPRWIGKYESTYIHAPIVGSWYDLEVLNEELPKIEPYDILLIDGPPWVIGRSGFAFNLDLFDTSVPIFFDDIHRSDDALLVKTVSQMLDRPWLPWVSKDDSFGVIPK